MKNSPVFTIQNVISQDDICDVKILVKDFTNIRATKLLIAFDQNYIDIIEVNKNPNLSGNINSTLTSPSWGTEYQTYPGSIILSCYDTNSRSLNDDDYFVSLKIKKIQKGISQIRFDNSQIYNCRCMGDEVIEIPGVPSNTIYRELIDTPYENFYIDGNIEFTDVIEEPILKFEEPIIIEPEVPIFPEKSTIAIRKEIMDYTSKPTERCELCEHYIECCTLGNFTVTKSGICEWYIEKGA